MGTCGGNSQAMRRFRSFWIGVTKNGDARATRTNPIDGKGTGGGGEARITG